MIGDDRPPLGFEVVERVPGGADSALGGPYRAALSTPRLPWVSIHWLGYDGSPKKITVTDRFISASRGLLRMGKRFEISSVREVLLFAPGADLPERDPSSAWWLAVREGGEIHLLASVEYERAARWLHGHVERLHAERVELRRIGGSCSP